MELQERIARAVKAATDRKESRGGGVVTAENDIHIENGGGFAVVAKGDIHIGQGGGAFLVAGGDLQVQNGGGAILKAQQARVEKGQVGVLVADQAELVDSKVLLTSGQVATFGLIVGATFALVTYLMRMWQRGEI